MAKKTNCVKNGVPYYRVSKIIDGVKKEFYGSCKSDAEAKRDEYIKNTSLGLNADYKEMTLKDLMKIWLYEDIRINRAYNTMDRYDCVYRNYVLPSPLANMKPYEIKPLTLRRYYNDMFEDGKSSSKIFNLNKLLKTFFYFAKNEGYVISNPCEKLELPKEKKELLSDDEDESSEVDPFTNEELTKIKKAIKPDLEMLIAFDLATGLRRGELLGLSIKNVDIDKKEVRVRRALKRVKKIKKDGTYTYDVVLESTKTEKSVRTVPLPTSLIAPLKQHIIKQKEKHFQNGIPFDNNVLLFTTRSCSPLDGKNVLRAWTRTLNRAGVRYRKFHNIRHTYATKLFEADVRLETVSALLGHANVRITADTYIHIMPKEKANAIEHVNFVF